MLRNDRARKGRSAESGFTLVELTVVLAVMGVVLIIAGSGLISLSTTTSRGSAMVTDEQNASTVMAQLAKDIRSAHRINFPTGTVESQTPNELVLQENRPDGTTHYVKWLYQAPVPPAQTGSLIREVQVSGTYSQSGPSVSGVVDPAGLFTYFNKDGGSAGSDPVTLGNCTTRIQVNLDLASAVSGVSNFNETEDVTITDQVAILSQPDNGQC